MNPNDSLAAYPLKFSMDSGASQLQFGLLSVALKISGKCLPKPVLVSEPGSFFTAFDQYMLLIQKGLHSIILATQLLQPMPFARSYWTCLEAQDAVPQDGAEAAEYCR